MIYRFLLASDEIENYKVEIKIDTDDTFYDLHKIIMKCNRFEEVEMTSFFMCDDDWRRKQDIITLVEIETDSDVDSFVMKDEVLSDWIDEEKQKLIFIFDYFNDRGLYIELAEIIFGENLSKPYCKKQGDSPIQFIEKEEIEVPKPNITPTLLNDIDDEFYGDEDYELDEIDADGFEGLDDEDIEDLNVETHEDTDLI